MRWHWQYLTPFILLFLGVDWAFMPMIKSYGVNNWVLFSFTSILSIVELVCWYLFWKWFRKVPVLEFANRVVETKKIQEGIELGKKIQATLKKAGLWEKIKTMILDYIFNTYRWATSENNRFMKWAKRGGSFGMVGLGACPEPGTRIFGTVFCGTTGWQKGLYLLAIGDIMRVGIMVGIWHVIFSLLKN